jgi:hypothetical protein
MAVQAEEEILLQQRADDPWSSFLIEERMTIKEPHQGIALLEPSRKRDAMNQLFPI